MLSGHVLLDRASAMSRRGDDPCIHVTLLVRAVVELVGLPGARVSAMGSMKHARF